MIECPRAKSEMTPCYVKDGDLAIAQGSGQREICVGCERSIRLLREESAKNEWRGECGHVWRIDLAEDCPYCIYGADYPEAVADATKAETRVDELVELVNSLSWSLQAITHGNDEENRAIAEKALDRIRADPIWNHTEPSDDPGTFAP